MAVGLGTGSTAAYAIRRLAERIAQGQLRSIVGVPTSEGSAALAASLGVPLTSLDARPALDLTVDGADEVDPDGGLIKGGGGALLREKIVAQASRRLVICVDEGKLSPRLGRHPLPVAVFPFGWPAQARFLESLGARPALRKGEGGEPFRTDDGLYVLDCAFGQIADAGALCRALDGRAGIGAHGLFLDLATDLVVAGASGVAHRALRRAEAPGPARPR
jgi:ribose 5-phosphate isomerase A